MFQLIYLLVVASTGMPFGTVTVPDPMDRDTCVAYLQRTEQTERIQAWVKEGSGVDVEAMPVCHPIEVPGRSA